MVESVDTLKNQLSGLQKKYFEIEELNKNLNERLLEIYSLYQISFALSLTLDLEEILKSIKNLIRKTFNVDQYSIMLLNDTTEHLKIISSYGISRSVRDSDIYKYGIDIFGKALELEEIIYVAEMAQEFQYGFYPNGKKSKNGAFLTIPLKPDNGQPLGVLNLTRNKIDSFARQEIELFTKIAEQIAKVIDKTLLYKHTKELSITDDLTGIYNRRYFNQRFEREVIRTKRYKRPLSIIMIDIDFFKNYNDLNGHILGDDVLKKVAYLLEHSIRKADILSRYGGEEFVLLLPETDKDHSLQVAEKLRRTIESNSFPGEHKQPNEKITVSLGVSTLLEDTYSAQELIEFADKALYEAKRLGRNYVVGYHTGLNFDFARSIHSIDSFVPGSLE